MTLEIGRAPGTDGLRPRFGPDQTALLARESRRSKLLAYLAVAASALDRVDELLGEPDASGSLDPRAHELAHTVQAARGEITRARQIGKELGP